MDMGGFPVRQPFPTRQVDMIDPFLLLHHARVKPLENRGADMQGVGPHPHRGFSPVTFIFRGGVHHRDSRGNDSTIYAGGTQWMNAGMGIIHSERPPQDLVDEHGEQEIIQLWINTPAKYKMSQPAYYPLTAEDTPKVTSEDAKVKIGVVSGEFKDIKGPVPSLSPVLALRIEAHTGGEYYFPLPENHNAFLYLLEGKLNIDKYGIVEDKHAVVFRKDGEGIGIKFLEDSKAILLTGEPLNEPVVSHGPFVMNTQTEILQAMRDYQMGKMGILIEE